MKKTFFAAALMIAIGAASVSCDDDNNESNRPTAAEFEASRLESLTEITQHFNFTAGSGTATFTSSRGVQIMFNSNNLTLNGNPVTGPVTLDFIEIFDKGTMAVTNKPTRGTMSNGDLALIISGGEFYLNASQNGQNLVINSSISMIVPGGQTGGMDGNMGLWKPTEIDTITADEVVWQEADPAINGGFFGQGGAEGGSYYGNLFGFGWCNVDMYYSDPRPKTTILAKAPDGYDFENSCIYLSYDGFRHALALLDTQVAGTPGLFTEHYGQIPIGLECHVIFMAVEGDGYRYAIKPKTITGGETITFTMAETTTGTKEQLVAAINAVQ
jgi:hypothetical protein